MGSNNPHTHAHTENVIREFECQRGGPVDYDRMDKYGGATCLDQIARMPCAHANSHNAEVQLWYTRSAPGMIAHDRAKELAMFKP